VSVIYPAMRPQHDHDCISDREDDYYRRHPDDRNHEDVNEVVGDRHRGQEIHEHNYARHSHDHDDVDVEEVLVEGDRYRGEGEMFAERATLSTSTSTGDAVTLMSLLVPDLPGPTRSSMKGITRVTVSLKVTIMITTMTTNALRFTSITAVTRAMWSSRMARSTDTAW